MTTVPIDVSDLIHDVNATDEARGDQGIGARRVTGTATGNGIQSATADTPLVMGKDVAWHSHVGWNGRDIGSGSSLVSPDGVWCGLFAVDIAGFNGPRRNDDIQIYIHKSLYEMLQVAFDRSDVPWSGCAHEDRGDGVLVIVPPMIPITQLVDPIPERLRGLIRRHNRVSCEAACIQLRAAMHIGPVHYNGHGFVGHDVNLLYRLLDARPLKQMLAQSGSELAFITSEYVYENVIRRRPSLVDPVSFQSMRIRVKETRTRAWACVPGSSAV